jgi:hypothetical protein
LGANNSFFSPASFFANGEQGWWYDPSNFATLFQDAAGATPVTAVEQPVGLQLDLSQGLVLGSELITPEANRDFSSDTGYWTKETNVTISGGKANWNGAVNDFALFRDGLISASTYYSVTFTISGYVGGGIKVYASGSFSATYSANGTYTVRLRSGSAASRLGFYASGSSTTLSIDDVSIKEVAGNHRFQTTSANRPVVSARVNLLTKTEQFNDAIWLKTGATVTSNTTIAPDGTLTADTLTAIATASYVTYSQTGNPAAGTYTFSTSVKKGISFNLLSDDGTANGIGAIFDGATGAKVANAVLGSGWTLVASSCNTHPTDSAFWLASITVTRPTATLLWNNSVALNKSKSTTYAGSTTVGDTLDVWGADLRVSNIGVNLPAYQRVNTSTDYDSTGFPTYIKPNGSNQFMVTNSINFSATDKMTVWQGVRKLSDAATAALMELSSSWVANAGSFVFLAPDGVGTFVSGSRGTAIAVLNQTAAASPYAAPITDVLFSSHDIAADLTTLRVNTVAATSATGDKGTGNFGTYPAYFYMRAGTAFAFNGHDYGSIARGAASTAAQITAGETYINSLTKAF